MNIVEEVLRTAGAGKDVSMDSIRTPGRPNAGRKLSSNTSERELWNAFRAAGTGESHSSSRRRVDVDLDGSPFVQKTGDMGALIGGVEDRSTMMNVQALKNGDHTAASLGDWQESEDWLN